MGLKDPTGLAVRPAERGGGVELFVADSGRVFSTVWKDGESSPPEFVVGGLPEGPICLGWFDQKTLMVASTQVATYELGGQAEAAGPIAVARAAGPFGVIRSIAANTRFVYAVGGGSLLRSRRVGKRLTSLRAVSSDPSPSATVAVSPLGYLLTLGTGQRAGKPAWRLSYHDPEQPDTMVAVLEVRGLGQAIQMTYVESKDSREGQLYVLDSGSEGGIYRIDSAYDTEKQTRVAAARKILPVDRPRAFAAGPDNALYVVAIAEASAGGGVVLRHPLGTSE